MMRVVGRPKYCTPKRTDQASHVHIGRRGDARGRNAVVPGVAVGPPHDAAAARGARRVDVLAEILADADQQPVDEVGDVAVEKLVGEFGPVHVLRVVDFHVPGRDILRAGVRALGLRLVRGVQAGDGRQLEGAEARVIEDRRQRVAGQRTHVDPRGVDLREHEVGHELGTGGGGPGHQTIGDGALL